jgi:hypothetical protein
MWKNHIKFWKYKALLTGEKGQQTLIKTENTVFNKMI